MCFCVLFAAYPVFSQTEVEVHVDSTFRIFELYLAGDVVYRMISRRPQQELYANLQLERVKVIYPVASVSVKFENMNGKQVGR